MAARRTTLPDDTRRALPPRSPTGMARSRWVRFLAELRVMPKPAGLSIGGFRTLAGAWAGFRDWTMRSNLRLMIYKDCISAAEIFGLLGVLIDRNGDRLNCW